ncbi:MAG: zf-TFIIB domain-containing protein [Fibrobacter sp.]|nr:zf-TFIIB domain-containing protein [Fibrobacter sp.]
MSTKSGKCEHCNAPLGHGAIKCSYCGGINDVDLKGHYFTLHEPEEERICAGCDQVMQTLNIRSSEAPFYIERCDNCLGIFLDNGEIDLIINDHDKLVHTIDHIRLGALKEIPRNEAVKYVKCPVCQKVMNRMNFGDSSGIIIDQCRDHGIYLDAGELQRIVSWVKQGGLRRNEQREALKKEDFQWREVFHAETRSQHNYDRRAQSFLRGLGNFIQHLWS